MKIEYKIENNKITINQILQNELKISSRLLFKLIKNNKISLNENICDTRNIPDIGNILSIDFNYEEDNSNIIPTKMELNTIYEDDLLLVVNIHAGIASDPSIL